MSAEGIIRAPWTAEQVAALNRFQTAGWWHSFTCGNNSLHPDLVAEADGWHCPDCDYRQDWAHDFMADRGTMRVMEAIHGANQEPEP